MNQQSYNPHLSQSDRSSAKTKVKHIALRSSQIIYSLTLAFCLHTLQHQRLTFSMLIRFISNKIYYPCQSSRHFSLSNTNWRANKPTISTYNQLRNHRGPLITTKVTYHASLFLSLLCQLFCASS